MSHTEEETAPIAEHSIEYAVLDPSGQFAATVGKDSVLRIWSLADCEIVAQWRVPDGPPQAIAISATVRTVAISVAGSDAIWLYDIATGAQRLGLPFQDDRGCVMAFSPDGVVLAASGRDGAIFCYDMAAERPVRVLPAFGPRTIAISYTLDGKHLAVVNEDGDLRVWDVKKRIPIAFQHTHADGVRRVACDLGVERTLLLQGSGDAVLWDMSLGRTVMQIPASSPDVVAVAWTAEGFVCLVLDQEGKPLLLVVPVDEEEIRRRASDFERMLRWPQAERDDLARRIQESEEGLRQAREAMRTARARAFAENEFVIWLRQLRDLVVDFPTARTAIQAELASERADMVNALTSIPLEARTRIAPVAVESATSMFEMRAWTIAIGQILRANPLGPVAAMLLLYVLALFAAPIVGPLFGDVTHGLAGVHDYVIAIGSFTVTGAAILVLGRLGSFIRLLRNIMQAMAIAVLVPAVGLTVQVPAWAVPAIRKYLHREPFAPWHYSLPYPVWLGCDFAVWLSAAVGLALWYTRALRAPRRRMMRGALLHALLDLAYELQALVDEPKGASEPDRRRHVVHLIDLAARIAEREWLTAMLLRDRKTDKVMRRQSQAIAVAIRRWRTRAALGGAATAEVCRAFSIAVINAAEEDWAVLGVDHTQLPKPRSMLVRRLIMEFVAVAVPITGAGALFAFMHPVTQWIPLITVLVGMAFARVLRWFNLVEDFDTGSKIAELLRKPDGAKTEGAAA